MHDDEDGQGDKLRRISIPGGKYLGRLGFELGYFLLKASAGKGNSLGLEGRAVLVDLSARGRS